MAGSVTTNSNVVNTALGLVLGPVSTLIGNINTNPTKTGSDSIFTPVISDTSFSLLSTDSGLGDVAVIAAIPFDKEDGISTTLNTDNIIISTPVDNSLTTIDTIESLRSGLDGFGLLGQVINYGIDAANYVYTNLSQTTLQDLAEAPVEPSVVSENSAGGGFSFLLNAVLIPYLTVLLPIPAPAEKLPPPTLPTTTR